MEEVGDVENAVQGGHDFVAQRRGQLLREGVLHLGSLVLLELCDVVDHKHLQRLVFDRDALDLDFQDFRQNVVGDQLFRSVRVDPLLKVEHFGSRVEVALEVAVTMRQGLQTLQLAITRADDCPQAF